MHAALVVIAMQVNAFYRYLMLQRDTGVLKLFLTFSLKELQLDLYYGPKKNMSGEWFRFDKTPKKYVGRMLWNIEADNLRHLPAPGLYNRSTNPLCILLSPTAHQDP